jgi:hypothetical protein
MRSMVEGACRKVGLMRRAPSVSLWLPPPRAGEDQEEVSPIAIAPGNPGPLNTSAE